MNARNAALLTLAAALLLLGASVADWATITVDEPFGEEVVVERTETVAGPEVAGNLITVGLAALVVAGLAVRWPRLGGVTVALGLVGAVTAIDGLTPDAGVATSAPGMALAACVGLVAGGGIAVASTTRRPEAGDPTGPSRPDGPSRYTVEAVRGYAAAGPDDWELAAADDESADPDAMTEDDT